MLSLDRNGDSPKQDACFPRLHYRVYQHNKSKELKFLHAPLLQKEKPKALLPIREVLHK